MCISGGKSNFSYGTAAWPPPNSGGAWPMTHSLSTTSAPDASRAASWWTKSAPLSRGNAPTNGGPMASTAQARLQALCPPRPPMPRIKRERMRPSAGERFLRALATYIAHWGEEDTPALPFIHRMEILSERDWSSATFVGSRVRIMLSYAPVDEAAVARLSARLTSADYRLGAYILADLATDARHGGMLLEALVLEMH